MTDKRTLHAKRLEDLVPVEPGTVGFFIRQYLSQLAIRGYSPHSIRSRTIHLRYLAVWANERDVSRLEDITPELLERYQRTLFHARKANGKPLTFRFQYDCLADVRRFFKWLLRQHVIAANPTDFLDLPHQERRLPKAILTAQEAEKVLAQPKVITRDGLRDRAILETLYATGIRRQEIVSLRVHDIDIEAGSLTVRQGKGKKDRMVPLGERAAAWLEKYLEDVRPNFVREPDEGWLFLTRLHLPYTPQAMAKLVHRYIDQAEIGKTGACHLFRHTMATLMLEGGAELRFIQAMLGHADISTTQIYTRVAIRQLKEVHARTHPGAHLERKHVLSSEETEGSPADDTERSELPPSSLAAGFADPQA
jgi:integrase/recombinase XerD